MGFIFLGIATLSLVGITGAVLVMIAHGFLAALSFALMRLPLSTDRHVGYRPTGGLLRKLPFIGTLLVMAAFAACGLPGFANFAGEVTVFLWRMGRVSARDDPGLLGRAHWSAQSICCAWCGTFCTGPCLNGGARSLTLRTSESSCRLSSS
jgi:NADH:ubiquinone oxidoreductase subunit 5 (subunit L)/multisubunit Na+/H+ antiporter MnhA subunit